MENLRVTSLEQLKKVKQTVVIDLGKFEDGTPLIAEVKRPDIITLATQNKIPNSLLEEAMKVFNGTSSETIKKVTLENDFEALKHLGDLFEMLTEECLVNPKYSDLKEIGLDLTMEMRMNILSFAQIGVEGLKTFREKQERAESNKSSDEIQQTSIGDSKD